MSISLAVRLKTIDQRESKSLWEIYVGGKERLKCGASQRRNLLPRKRQASNLAMSQAASIDRSELRQ